MVLSYVETGLVKHPIEWKTEGMIEGKRRRGRRCKLILEDLKEKRKNWKLKIEKGSTRSHAVQEAMDFLRERLRVQLM